VSHPLFTELLTKVRARITSHANILPRTHLPVTRRCTLVTRPVAAGAAAPNFRRPGSKRRRDGQQEVRQVSQPEPDDVSRLDDFQVLSERRRVIEALAVLTQEYKRLTDEMTRRETLRWMVAP
jgi:hypothetical protein